MSAERAPLKRVAALLNVSRSSLWRASRSGIEGFPAPIIERTRVYWRTSDLPALQEALEHYQGRGGFERQRRHDTARKALEEALKLKKKSKPHQPVSDQPDLFQSPQQSSD